MSRLFLTIILSLASIDKITKAVAQKANSGNSTGNASSATRFNQSAIESVYTSLRLQKHRPTTLPNRMKVLRLWHRHLIRLIPLNQLWDLFLIRKFYCPRL